MMGYFQRTQTYWFAVLFFEGMLYLKADKDSGTEAFYMILMGLMLIFIILGCPSRGVDNDL